MSTIRVVNLQHTDATEPNIVLESDGTAVFASGITISGGTNLTISGIAEFASGTVSAPTITFIDDTNTGIYEPAVDTVAITTAATERLRVDSSGRLLLGISSSRDSANINQPYIQREGTTVSTSALAVIRNSADTGGSILALSKTRGTSTGSNTIVQNGDTLGSIYFAGADGTDVNSYAAWIEAAVDGTPGVNDMPGRLMFYTTADGASSPTERMRIDSSGNVGIGTTSPGQPLAVVATSSTYKGMELITPTGDGSGEFIFGVHQNGSTAGRNIVFKRGGSDGTATESMRIDSSGNVGIGATSPSSPINTGRLMVQGGDIVVRDDPDGNQWRRGVLVFDIRNSNGDAKPAAIIGGKPNDIGSDIQFYTTVSHAYGERMRIDASGRVLVGATASVSSSSSVNSTFQVHSTSGPAMFGRFANDATASALYIIKSRNTTVGGQTIVNNGDNIGRIAFEASDGSQLRRAATVDAFVDGAPGSADMPGRLVFSTTADGASSPTERMRITNQGATWAAANTSIETHGSVVHYHGWSQGDGNQWAGTFRNVDTSGGYGLVIAHPNSSTSNTSYWFLNCNNSAGNKAIIYTNGGLANYQSNNANLCDEREKKNIETLDSTWGCLKNWELKKFHYNEDADTDDKRYGVIAQQVQTVCPEVITDWTKQKAEEAVLDEDGNVVTPAKEEIIRMGVKEQQMMWMAIKALQEAQDRIETLEAKVAALESK